MRGERREQWLELASAEPYIEPYTHHRRAAMNGHLEKKEDSKTFLQVLSVSLVLLVHQYIA